MKAYETGGRFHHCQVEGYVGLLCHKCGKLDTSLGGTEYTDTGRCGEITPFWLQVRQGIRCKPPRSSIDPRARLLGWRFQAIRVFYRQEPPSRHLGKGGSSGKTTTCLKPCFSIYTLPLTIASSIPHPRSQLLAALSWLR